MRPASEARRILSARYQALLGSEPPWPALLLLLSQSRGEGRWGELGGVDALGEPYEENWGAVQSKTGPPCPPGTFQHGDSKPTASGQKPFQWCFIGYSPSDPEGPNKGADDFLRHALIYRPHAQKPLLTGNPDAYARALYGTGKTPYFGGFGATTEERIQSYVRMLKGQALEVTRELGMPPPSFPPPEHQTPPKGPTPAPALRARSGAPLALIALGALGLILTARK